TAGRVRIGGADATGRSLAERGGRTGFVAQEPGRMVSRPPVPAETARRPRGRALPGGEGRRRRAEVLAGCGLRPLRFRPPSALGLRARALPEEEIARRSEEVLEVCGLRPFRSWPLSALSHGQRNRGSIAAVLALEPEVLLLDEPTAGQDHAHYSEFMEFLRGVHRAGTTVVLITHDMHLALEYTRRVLVLSGGHLLADDHPAAVLTDPELSARADLVTTGLYDLARRCGVPDPARLVRRVIAADRREREEAR